MSIELFVTQNLVCIFHVKLLTICACHTDQLLIGVVHVGFELVVVNLPITSAITNCQFRPFELGPKGSVVVVEEPSGQLWMRALSNKVAD